jgi:hypothetical protein
MIQKTNKTFNQEEFIKNTLNTVQKIQKELKKFDMTIFDKIDNINFDFETENEKNSNLA